MRGPGRERHSLLEQADLARQRLCHATEPFASLPEAGPGHMSNTHACAQEVYPRYSGSFGKQLKQAKLSPGGQLGAGAVVVDPGVKSRARVEEKARARQGTDSSPPYASFAFEQLFVAVSAESESFERHGLQLTDFFPLLRSIEMRRAS